MNGSNSAHAVAPGDLIDGRYQILELIGEGGMGAVFRAEHVGLSKEVALKVIHPSFAGNGEIRARFTREAMASARVEHPHVASALDIGELSDGAAYLVMPLVRGPVLTDVLAEGPMPEPRVVAIGAQIADALSAAHAAGIVHRDLKPDNVVLTPRDDGGDHVKVLDFGIAGLSGEETPGEKQLTRAGAVMGTPGYMAPEQAVGEPADVRADLYALGVILWEALTGRALFAGDDLAAIVTEQLTSTPAPVRELGAVAREDLEALVARLLSRSKEDRPASAAEVRDALVALAPERQVREAPDSAPTPRDTIPASAVPRAALPTIPARVEAAAGTIRQRAEGLASRFRAMPPRVQVGASAGLAVLLIAAALFGGGEEGGDEGAPPTEVGLTAEAPAKKPRPSATPKTRREPKVPGELEDALERLVGGSSRRIRTEAAKALDAHEGPLPDYVRAMVAMELARGCADRKAALDELTELADRRTRGYVEIWDGAPKRGCGFMKQRDCYACIRGDIARTLAALE